VHFSPSPTGRCHLWSLALTGCDFNYGARHPGSQALRAPSLDDLGSQLHALFNFLADLDDAEQRIAVGGAGSRSLVLETISNLPGSRFTNRPLY
jgi:hypothetical protein